MMVVGANPLFGIKIGIVPSNFDQGVNMNWKCTFVPGPAKAVVGMTQQNTQVAMAFGCVWM